MFFILMNLWEFSKDIKYNEHCAEVRLKTDIRRKTAALLDWRQGILDYRNTADIKFHVDF
jgi:hypothetical protein